MYSWKNILLEGNLFAQTKILALLTKVKPFLKLGITMKEEIAHEGE
jgi:hypothetical protein